MSGSVYEGPHRKCARSPLLSACPRRSLCLPWPLPSRRPSMPFSLIRARMTTKNSSRPPIPLLLLPLPILVAKTLSPPLITDTITRVPLQPLTPSILIQHLQPPPTYSLPTTLPTSSPGLNPAPLRLQPIPRKTLNPHATFIVTVSPHLVGPSLLLLPKPRFPIRPSRPLPTSTRLLLQQVTILTPFTVLISPHPPPGALI
jgi:hypothetical protein